MPPTAEESSRYRSAIKYLPGYNPEEEPLKPSSVPLDPSVLKPDDSCFVAQASTFNSTGVALHVSQNPRLEPPLDFTTDEPLMFFYALTHPKIHVPVTVTKPITRSKPPRSAATVTFHSMGAGVKTLILLLGQKPQSASPSAQYHHFGQTDLMLQQNIYQVKKKCELVES